MWYAALRRAGTVFSSLKAKSDFSFYCSAGKFHPDGRDRVPLQEHQEYPGLRRRKGLGRPPVKSVRAREVPWALLTEQVTTVPTNSSLSVSGTAICAVSSLNRTANGLVYFIEVVPSLVYPHQPTVGSDNDGMALHLRHPSPAPIAIPPPAAIRLKLESW